MSTDRFDAAFSPRGAIDLRQLHVEPEAGDSVRCRVSLTVDHQPVDLEVSALGTIGAISELLYGLDAGVEIVALYQQDDDGQVAAYLQCARGEQRCWSYGRAAGGDEATVRALISAANQLTGRRAA
ncbi:hypothetical protein [Gordonia caeni]|uniref:2-isopropylmalate synthase LeuA allosteric (dimerisation) domain-containing protein n=1 Tax=Gordonia caeni TaxID=1007097 RepID=A0ABP7NTX3_9ACTN